MLNLLSIRKISPSQKKELINLFSKKVDNYTTSVTFLTIKEQKNFIKRCKDIKTYASYEFNVDYEDYDNINKNPFIIYLTKKQAKENIKALKNKKLYTIKFTSHHFRKVCRETINVNRRLLHLLGNIYASQRKGYKPPIYKPPKDDYWPLKPTKEVLLYKKPSKRTISFSFKKRSKDFIKKFIKKDKIKNYYPTIVYLTKIDLTFYLEAIKEIMSKSKHDENDGFSLIVKKKIVDLDEDKGFIFYLTKTQIKKLNNFKMNKGLSFTAINFSITQLLETYKEVIEVNSKIYSYLKKKFFKKTYTPPPPPPKLLALTDKPYNKQELLSLTENLKKDLIDFSDEEKDLIDFSDEEKDLIDLNVILPNPKPKPTAKKLLMDKELFPKGKKYKVLNEDLIQTNTKPSTNGKNILKNILNYPETKRLLGISLTTDLKNKIKNLDSEASFGLASIITSLLTANRGKMSIYSISRNQLKEIIEGFITTLSVLLNPTQKY